MSSAWAGQHIEVHRQTVHIEVIFMHKTALSKWHKKGVVEKLGFVFWKEKTCVLTKCCQQIPTYPPLLMPTWDAR